MNKLIIVCGLPGVGKTTIARELSKKLKIFCLHKDTLKESLYNSLKMKTLEDSKKIGWPSVKGILDLAEENLNLGIDVILESTFNFPEDVHIFDKWKDKIKIYTIILEVEDKERKIRFMNRERHKAHHDNERKRQYAETECSYEYMPGKKLVIRTDELIKVTTNKIIKFIS